MTDDIRDEWDEIQKDLQMAKAAEAKWKMNMKPREERSWPNPSNKASKSSGSSSIDPYEVYGTISSVTV